MSILSIRSLVKIYRGRQAVSGVTLEVESGRVVGLLGPNGAGKTTTFYMTVGMIRPDGGQVFLDGEDITSCPMHVRAQKGVGYLPQETSVFRKLSVWQNMMAVMEFLPMTGKERRHRARELLGELGIEGLADRKAGVLSGGERRRLEISRALAADPSFMLLDEPFAGVDPLAVNDIKGIIRHLKARGIGVLISDHNVRETLTTCDTACIMNKGEVLASGAPEDIAGDPVARRVYLGEEFRL